MIAFLLLISLHGWSAGVPKLGPSAYRDSSGWHDLQIWDRDYGKLPLAWEVMDICRSHKWKGYIHWQDGDHWTETCSCSFVKPITGTSLNK